MTKDKKDILGAEDRRWLADHGYLLAAMNEPECVTFLSLLNPVSLQDGEVLFEEGEPGDRLFIIHRGVVEMGRLSDPRSWVDFGPYGCVDLEDTNVHTASTVWLRHGNLQEGDCVGEIESMAERPHTMTARAKGNVELFCLDAEDIKMLADKGTHFCACLATALARTNHKVFSAG